MSGDSTDGLSPAQAVYRLLNGHVIARAAYIAIELDLADKIRDGHTNAESLANAADVDAQVIYRILRILAGQGVLRESEDRQFALTSMGEVLLSDSPESIAAHGILTHHPATRAALGDLFYTVRTGETAFDHVMGESWVEHMASDNEFAEVFHRAMNGLSRMHNSSVAEAYDFSRHNRIVDVGGGNGALLSAILSRNEKLSGVLLDRESAINQAQAAGTAVFDLGYLDFAPGTGFQFGETTITFLSGHYWPTHYSSIFRENGTCRDLSKIASVQMPICS